MRLETFRNPRVRQAREGRPAQFVTALEEDEKRAARVGKATTGRSTDQVGARVGEAPAQATGGSTDEVGARVGGGSSEFTSDEGGGACRPNKTEREMGLEPTTFSLEG